MNSSNNFNKKNQKIQQEKCYFLLANNHLKSLHYSLEMGKPKKWKKNSQLYLITNRFLKEKLKLYMKCKV